MKVIVVIPAHNRRDTTLTCLRHLSEAGVFEWATVIVVDDASGDGTAEAVEHQYPRTQILRGDGNLWWGGAINVGMKAGIAQGGTHIVWLNDDCIPTRDSLQSLIGCSVLHQAIAVGQARLLETGEVCYGGFVRVGGAEVRLLDCKPGDLVPCDTFSGNCVCLPVEAIRRIGFIDTDVLPHAWGDADYGFRAQLAGIKALVVGAATCASTYGYLKNRMSWLLGELDVRSLWSVVWSPPGGCLSRSGWVYHARNFGVAGVCHQFKSVLRLIVTTLLRLVIPRPWLVHWFAPHSRSYRRMEQVRDWSATRSAQPMNSEA